MVDKLPSQYLSFAVLPELACDFHWDTVTLQARIKAYKPDYNPEDPWTWPCIRAATHPGYQGNAMSRASLPRGIAYPQDIVNTFTQELRYIAIQQSTTGRFVDMQHDIYNFPFSYTAENVITQGNHGRLTGTQRRAWIRQVTGADPEPMLGKSLEEEVAKQTPPPKPMTSTEAFEEVLNMMNDTPPADTAELDALRIELSRVKTKLVSAEEENTLSAKQAKSAQVAQLRAEVRMRILEADHDSFKKLADDYTSKYMAAHRDLEASYKQREQELTLHEQEKEKTRVQTRINKTLEQTLRKKNIELMSAREEARIAKEQVLRIWTMMKTAKKTESQKRKGGRDAVSAEAKKARARY